MTLTFADTHNMIVYLIKSDASEGLDQFINFLNASSIKYALTVNPNIYVSCIKQFWSSVLVKKVNDVMRLQALVDKKKVIITEATIRDAFRLDDVESIDCLPNEEIFTELSRKGLVRNVDNSTKFYMYPRFLQLMIRAQVGDLSSHSTKYSFPALIQKLFANMRRVGKGFSRVDTPLFEGMIMAQQDYDITDEGASNVVVDDVPAAVDEPSIPSPTLTTQPPPPSQDLPSTSQDKIAQSLEITRLKQRVKKLERRNKLKVYKLRRLKRVGTTQRVNTSDDTVIDDVSKQGRIIASMDADKDVTLKDAADIAKEVVVDAEIKESADDDELEPAELQEVVEVVTTTKLMIEVVTATSATITAATTLIPTTLIPAAAITNAPSAARRRKRVVIRDLDETAIPSIIIHSKPKSKDKGKGILVEEPKPLKKQARIEQDEAYARELEAELNKNINWDDRKPQTEAQARKNMMIYLRNMVGVKMDYFKGMKYDDIRLIFEKYFNFNVAFLEKTKEQMEEEDSKALKRISKSQEENAAKKQKFDEGVEELKRHLQIVPNDEDDVYTKATPLARKVPIVDYDIYTKNNKPYYKIIRADGSLQLFLSFLSLLRNFNREDLEVLWQLVKERFASSKPKNFLDDFLLTTLTYMFEKPDVQAQVSKNQKTVYGLAKVKSWRLLESCRVHIITFTSTQMILLVEKRYPLTRFTLDQMLNNVRLEIEEESEVSLELLRFTIIPLARFTFHERVMDPLDISRNPTKEKGKRVASSSFICFSSTSSDDNEAPSFLEFYEELSKNENLPHA
nr:hypothetical protein [Tanacetum cinerariifolium]